jgi:ubiquinone/menaquinone biosynthesis C-methylase UbiE
MEDNSRVESLKAFYEKDARIRHAGSSLTTVHEISLNMMDIQFRDVTFEIGCGAGALLSEISKKGSLTVGFDVSETQIKYAKRVCENAVLVVGDARRLPFRDNVFTKGFAIEVLEHLPNPANAVAETHRVLKRAGELIIVLPIDRNWFIHRVLQGAIYEAFYDYGHLHDFSSVEKLRPILKGFKVLESKENKVSVFPLFKIGSKIVRILDSKKIDSGSSENPNSHSRLYSYLKNVMRHLAPRLTLHLIIKIKKD